MWSTTYHSFARLWARASQEPKAGKKGPHKPRHAVPRCERLEERTLLSVSGREQLFVYLLNRARHDPVAYQREQNLPVNLSGVASQPPLAFNPSLFASTEFHAVDMASKNYFSHTTRTGLTPNQMVRNAGYALNSLFPSVGNSVESIAAGTVTDTAAEALNLFIVDQGVPSLGHRKHLLAMESFWTDHREIGVGHAYDVSSTYLNYWAVHTAYTSPSDKFLTGVVFHDANGNGRYDLNEGLPGVTVSVTGGASTVTNAAGGWSVKVSGTGAREVTASGGGFTGTSTATLLLGSSNVEVDFISGQADGFVNFERSGPSTNHAPVLSTAGTIALPATAEDAPAPAGALLSALVNSFITDANVGAVKGVAVTGTAGAGTWQFSSDGGTTWRNFGTVSGASALLLADTNRVRFVPDADANGTATFTFRAWDRTSGTDGGTADASAGGGETAFSTVARQAGVKVLPVNDAPRLTSATFTFPGTAEDTVSRTVSAGALLGPSVSDVDAGALRGIAVTGTGAGGTWQYSLDGGRTFRSFGPVSGTAALLLRSTDLLRCFPARNFNGSSSLTFRAWDRTAFSAGTRVNLTGAGTDGTTAFSAETGTATMAISAVNDAPVLKAGKPVLPAVTVNGPAPEGATVGSLLAGLASDVDAGALRGAAVVAAAGRGVWQFSTPSVNGGAWTSLTASASSALLLDEAARVRFVPNANYTLVSAASVRPALTFRAWDQTSGVVGGRASVTVTGGRSAFSAAAVAAAVRVNSAPVLSPRNRVLGRIASNGRLTMSVASLLGTSVSDAGTGVVEGIAVTGLSTAGGRWQYSTDGGRTFVNLGPVSEASALLLRATDRLRFVPRPGVTGAARITYRAWDQTAGGFGRRFDLTRPGTVGGHGAFSTEQDTATLWVR